MVCSQIVFVYLWFCLTPKPPPPIVFLIKQRHKERHTYVRHAVDALHLEDGPVAASARVWSANVSAYVGLAGSTPVTITVNNFILL